MVHFTKEDMARDDAQFKIDYANYLEHKKLYGSVKPHRVKPEVQKRQSYNGLGLFLLREDFIIQGGTNQYLIDGGYEAKLQTKFESIDDADFLCYGLNNLTGFDGVHSYDFS